ncbi:MAG TPA: Calx-beta domain-containing protein [Pyrinomonadaceae bacterium]|nr:Calx-beta domain-containing protein [Pyrinomonadaceae bacterium]
MSLRLHAPAFSGEKPGRRLKYPFALSAALLMMLWATTPVPAQNAPNVQLVNVNKNGSDSGNGTSHTSSGTVSADGRFVAFTSEASDLTALPDGNAASDVFVRDLKTAVTTFVSVNASGTAAGNGASGTFNDRGFTATSLALSADGRFVAFNSAASDLVANDTNNLNDVFVRDLATGVTILASVNAAGTASGNGNATFPYLSADGGMVGFRSTASNLVPNDTNNTTDVFVRNLKTGATMLVSVNGSGTASGNGPSSFSSFSADGRIVAFASSASDLVSNDSNGAVVDIFVRDLQAGTTTLASATPDGTGSGNNSSAVPSVSADGRFVVFNSRATNLVTLSDANGTDDVFVRDLAAGKTKLVSVNHEGTATGAGNSHLQSPQAISADGNFIAFASRAYDLVGNDTNGTINDVFVRDVAAGVTSLASANSAGTGSGDSFSASYEVSISADGRFVTFDSIADNLVAGMPTALAQQVFVRDMQQSETTLVSPNLSRSGGGNQDSFAVTVSADGSTVVFLSDATDFIMNDINNMLDVFAYTFPRNSCTYSISPTLRTSPAAGETLTVNVSTQAGCEWSVTNNSTFITVASGAGGTGNGTVTLTVPSNGSGVPRVGTVRIAGQTLTVVQPEVIPAIPTIQFAQANFRSSEGAARATLVITRTGDTAGTTTAGVQYQTVDDPAAVPCATANGTAYARCDYATTIDLVTFAPGEESKEVYIPLVDDAHVEGDETVQVTLGRPGGMAVLGAVATATLTITDNDAAGAPNPVFTTPFFVRQHYLDFLSREPEADEPWSAVLNRCPNVNNLDANSFSATCDRITVSASFFGSPEFRLKGFYAFTFYRVAFGRLPAYEEITHDMRFLTAATEPEVYARRSAFAYYFAEREEFRSRYDKLSSGAYVDALLKAYGLQQITTRSPHQPEQTTRVTMTRDSLVFGLEAPGLFRLTRGQVLRAIVESDEVSAAEYNRAFVAMQYYGYLRRTPEESGYNDWLRVINEDSKNVRLMVNGFMNSVEYRLRFGQ